jgi:hypothetical protein
LVLGRQWRLAGARVVDLVTIGPFFGNPSLKIKRYVRILARQRNAKSRQRFAEAMRVS